MLVYLLEDGYQSFVVSDNVTFEGKPVVMNVF